MIRIRKFTSKRHQLFTSLKLNMASWVQSASDVRCWICASAVLLLELVLHPMSLGMNQRQPQHSHSFSQATAVGRQICQSVASGVCFLRNRLLKCMLSQTFLVFFVGSTHAQHKKLIARSEWNNHKESVGSVGLWLHKQVTKYSYGRHRTKQLIQVLVLSFLPV